MAATLHGMAQVSRQRVLGCIGHALGTERAVVVQVGGGQGQYDEALGLYEQSLKIKQATLGLEHPSVAVTLHGMAQVSRQRVLGCIGHALGTERAVVVQVHL